MTSASPVSPAVARAAFALELARAEAATFQKAAQQRPENTSIQYKGKALEFKKWCDETQGFENEEIRYTITPQKANLFMIQKVVGRAIRKRKRASTTSADVDEAIEEGDDLDRAMAGEEPASSEVVDTPWQRRKLLRQSKELVLLWSKLMSPRSLIYGSIRSPTISIPIPALVMAHSQSSSSKRNMTKRTDGEQTLQTELTVPYKSLLTEWPADTAVDRYVARWIQLYGGINLDCESLWYKKPQVPLS